MPGAAGNGGRILIVEDEAALVLGLEMQLGDLGFVVVGPAATLARGLQLAQTEPLDGALLDVNLRGEQSYPIVYILLSREIPVIMMSGYARSSLPLDVRALPFLAKPFVPEVLERMAKRHFPPAAAASA